MTSYCFSGHSLTCVCVCVWHSEEAGVERGDGCDRCTAVG